MAEITLREALNNVRIVGVLKEKNLEVKNGENGKFISGYILIETDENNVHRVNIYSSEKTKDKKPSGLYKGIETVKDSYVSLADCSQNNLPPEHATKVVINTGRLGLNEYYSEDGTLHSTWSISTSFVSRLKGEDFTPVAQFEVEGFIAGVKNKDDKVSVQLIVPVYGGRVIPIDFNTTDKAGSFIEDNFKRGESAIFRGILLNIVEKEVKVKQGFGEAREDVTIKYVRSLVINDGDENPYDEDGDKAWSSKDIKSALEAREVYLEELQAKSGKKSSTSRSASASASESKDFF